MTALGMEHPLIIQGGMGVGVSNWVLAKAVALRGQLGVVSGTCLDAVLVRRLEDGDVGGHIRRAMEQFPMPEVVDEVLRKYFRPEGRVGLVPMAALKAALGAVLLTSGAKMLSKAQRRQPQTAHGPSRN